MYSILPRVNMLRWPQGRVRRTVACVFVVFRNDRAPPRPFGKVGIETPIQALLQAAIMQAIGRSLRNGV